MSEISHRTRIITEAQGLGLLPTTIEELPKHITDLIDTAIDTAEDKKEALRRLGTVQCLIGMHHKEQFFQQQLQETKKMKGNEIVVAKEQAPVIAGIEIPVDDEGKYNLNALHRASGTGADKAPNQWARSKQSKDLVDEITRLQLCSLPLEVVNGGKNPGTFAHELLAIEYAGWISSKFRLQVNQTFLDYRNGKLAPPADDGKLLLMKAKFEADERRKEEKHRQQMAERQFRFICKEYPGLSEEAKLAMLHDMCPWLAKALPYTGKTGGAKQKKAVKHLLDEYGLNISSMKFNNLMVDAGLMERNSRKRSSGKMATWCSFTEAGKRYGEDQNNPASPLQTQALFYRETFKELLLKLELIHKEAN